MQAPGPQAALDAPVLRKLRLPQERLLDVANALGLKYGYSPGITVTADSRSGELLVMAPQRVQVVIDREVRQMLASGVVQRAGRTVSTATVSRQFSLNHVSWREFEDSLQQVIGGRTPVTTRRNGELASFELVDQPIGRATVEVDRRANAVTVVAPEPVMDGWKTVIESLDHGGNGSSEMLQLVRMENAEPAPIQRAIRLLQQLKSGSDATPVEPTVGADGNRVRFLGTRFTPQDAPQGDVQQGGDAAADNQAGDNQGGDAVGVVGEDTGGLFGDVQIQFVPELGIIIVRGARRDVQRVMDVIKEIEQQSVLTQPEVEVYPLQHANSEALGELVEQLYTDVLNTRGSSLSITPLVRPNALLLVGRREAIASAIELIQKLDQPADSTSQLRVFRLEHASAQDAEETVRDFFTARPGSDEELRPGLGTRVRLIADYRTNSLIVQAAPRDLAEVARMIAELDVQTVPAKNELRVFELKNALAEELQPVLQEAITGEGDAATPENFTRPSTTLSILAVDAEGSRMIDSGLLAGALVTADANANALVVRAPSSSMPLIAELIRQLDTLPGAETVVKVFQLENSDAAALSQALTDLFAAQPTAGQNVAAGFAAAAGLPLELAQTTASPESSLVPLRFSTDVRTNSVIAAGSISDLEVVESVLLRLDTEGFATRITEVIWLRNADAVAVAEAMQNYVLQRQQGIQSIQQQIQPGGLSVYDAPDRDLIVVAEEISNSLLISVSPRIYDTVRRMIDQLDRRPPMVMIKVLLAEVALDDGFEWGSEFGVQDSLLFDRGVAGTNSVPGFNFNNAGLPNANTVGAEDLAGQALSTFGLGRTSQQFGYGGFVLSAASESVSLLIRSLQNANRLQVLSSPMIVTRDNTTAVVQVGQTVPRVTGVTGAGGLTGSTVVTTDIDVGLILRVTPRVGSDGMIRMDIDAERSAVGPIAEGIPVGFDANGNPILSPRIDRTRAQSTLTAFSGQTIVYGGLIQKRRSQFSRRVPYISDIPVLGLLFRFDQEIESRSELLAIMTPMIISGDEDAEYIKQVESSRMSYCIADVVEMYGDVGLSGGYGLWGPAVGPMIYPDLTPTVDDIHIQRAEDGTMVPGETLPPPIDGSSPGIVPGMAPGVPYDGVPEYVPGMQYLPPPGPPSIGPPSTGPMPTGSTTNGSASNGSTPTAPSPAGPTSGGAERLPPSVLNQPFPVAPSGHVQPVQHRVGTEGSPVEGVRTARQPQRIPLVR